MLVRALRIPTCPAAVRTPLQTAPLLAKEQRLNRRAQHVQRAGHRGHTAEGLRQLASAVQGQQECP